MGGSEVPSWCLAPEMLERTIEIAQGIDEEIAAGFAELWERESRIPLSSAGLREAALLYHTEKDKEFARRVIYGALVTAEQHPGRLTVLFDLDGSVVQERFNAKHELEHTRVRPAFPLVVRELDRTLGERFDAGIWSSRDQWKLDSELASPTYLATVFYKINPAFVVNPGEHEEKWPKFQDLVSANLDRAFVAVDDHPWVEGLSHEQGIVYGVYLPKGQADFDFY